MKQSGHDFQTALLPCIVQISGFLVDTVHCGRVSYGPQRSGGTSVHSVDRPIIDHSAETDLWSFLPRGCRVRTRLGIGRPEVTSDILRRCNRGLRPIWSTPSAAIRDRRKDVIFTGCQTIVLYPKSRNHRKMMVSVVFPTDQTFDGWMAEIPQIDAAHLRASWRR